MRAVSVLAVERPEIWDELARVVDLSAASPLDALRRVVESRFEAAALPLLRQQGISVLVRYARRTDAQIAAARSDLASIVALQAAPARTLLLRAQRHAQEGIVRGSRVWDPDHDQRHVRALLGAGLIEALPSEEPPLWGPFRLHPDLPPPSPVPYDFSDAAMGLTDDLSTPKESISQLLHDLAALTAAMSHHPPRRTLAGTLDRATVRRLGQRLGAEALAAHGQLADAPRWARALRTLEALGAVTMDPVSRELGLEPGLEETLAGDIGEAIDRLLHRLIDRDQQSALPALRAALVAAGDGAVDELIFVEELGRQHRDVLFAPWHRDGRAVYPGADDDRVIPFDTERFELVEGPMLRQMLGILERLGLLRRADGVFAGTADGRAWAGRPPPMPPVWITSDLGLTVPPNSVTPWERYQLERLGRCTQRDVVDVYRLERAGLDAWLATHELDDALDLLARRCPSVPPTVRETLRAWAAAAMRVTLTRGVVLDDELAR